MDSGNSTGGSVQSSSGGDEEYDSRAESISAFFNNPNPPTHHFPTTHPSPFFDPSSNYLDPMQPSPSLSNLDMVWSKPARSGPVHSDLGGFNPSSSTQAFFSSQLAGQTAQQPLVPEGSSRGIVPATSGADDQPSNNNVVRNPKKRSRASRRAPTTVLTTDTTNFRAMVQEFTGIPAPPFSSSPFQRTRLDLFGSSAVRSPPQPPYNLLRPFAQKPQPYQPFLSPLPAFPTTVDNLASNSTNSTTGSNSILYPLASDLGLLKHPLNVNMHNPLLNLPSIQFGNSPSILGSKPQGSSGIPPSAESHLKMGVLEDFGLNHVGVNANVSGLHQNMVSSSSEWAERTGTNNDGDHGVMRPSASGNYGNSERVTNGKSDYSAASSDFHGDRRPETVAARSEGMVESWINCSSD